MSNEIIAAVSAAVQPSLKMADVKLTDSLATVPNASNKLPDAHSMHQFSNAMKNKNERLSIGDLTPTASGNYTNIDLFRAKFSEMVADQVTRKIDVSKNVDSFKHLSTDMREMIAYSINQSNKQAEFSMLLIGVQGASEAKKSIEQSAKTLIQG